MRNTSHAEESPAVRPPEWRIPAYKNEAPRTAETLLAELATLAPEARASTLASVEEDEPRVLLALLDRLAGVRLSEGWTRMTVAESALGIWASEIRQKLEREAARPVELLAQVNALLVARSRPRTTRASDRLQSPASVALFHPFVRPFVLGTVNGEELVTASGAFSCFTKETWSQLEGSALRSIEAMRSKLAAGKMPGEDAAILDIFEIRDLQSFAALTAKYDQPGSSTATSIVHRSNSLLDSGLGPFLSTVSCPILLARWLESFGDVGHGRVLHDPISRAIENRISAVGGGVARSVSNAFWAQVEAAHTTKTDEGAA